RLYAIDADHLNTPRRLTNAQGQVVWQWLITGFGEANPTTGATGYAQSGQAGIRSYGEAVRFDLRYPGQVWDEETGLNYNLHRYYDAASGRYIQADPIGLEGGWNRFGYVGADPLNFSDDEGLQRRSAVPPVSYAQSLLNAQGVNLTSQIRQYQPNYAPMYVSAPGQGFTTINVRQMQSVLQGLQNGASCFSASNPNAGSIRGVNAIGGSMNCVNCAIATDATLAGNSASALGGGPFRISVLESTYGQRFGLPATSVDIINSMINAGNGARGIVYGAPLNGSVGHVFNVVNQNGVVRYLDGQTGGAASINGYRHLQLLRTN
ncbi:RHS repeat-associated core domain-containing protein, partial [Paracidovorax konjaci]